MPMTDAEKLVLSAALENPEMAMDALYENARLWAEGAALTYVLMHASRDFIERLACPAEYTDIIGDKHTRPDAAMLAKAVIEYLAAESEPQDAHDARCKITEAAEHPEDHEGSP